MAKMGRKPGKPKTGGRKKGTPNRVTADIRQLASLHGANMIKELARLALKSESEQVRVAAIREMLDRGYGKSVATHEITANVAIEPAEMSDMETARLSLYFMLERDNRIKANTEKTGNNND